MSKHIQTGPRMIATVRGFGLLELMLAAMIAAGITLGYLYNQSRQSAINQAQSQAGYYQMVSDAVAKYMAINYDQLKAITQPQTCSEPRLFTDAADATAATAPTGCGIQALFLSGSASSPVANGLQPTLADLKTTGYLDANFSNSFLWPTQLTMYAASGVSTGSSYAAPEYRVQIQAWCNGVAPSTDTVCDKPVLHSLVYNAQPFAANTDNSFINFTRLDRLMQARTALGANAFISYDWALKKDALLYSDGNKNQLPNLLKFTSGSDLGVGLEGVLALQATYIPVQVFSSPTPGPTPVMLPEKVPFSECDPTKDTFAFASQVNTRVVPRGVFEDASDAYCTNPDKLFHMSGGKSVKVVHWIGLGQALTCRPNGPATTYATACPIPAAWRTCVTQTEAATAPYEGEKYAYIKIRPKVVNGVANGSQAYCWQAYPEIWRRDADYGNPFNPPFELTDYLFGYTDAAYDQCKSSDCLVRFTYHVGR